MKFRCKYYLPNRARALGIITASSSLLLGVGLPKQGDERDRGGGLYPKGRGREAGLHVARKIGDTLAAAGLLARFTLTPRGAEPHRENGRVCRLLMPR